MTDRKEIKERRGISLPRGDWRINNEQWKNLINIKGEKGKKRKEKEKIAVLKIFWLQHGKDKMVQRFEVWVFERKGEQNGGNKSGNDTEGEGRGNN